MRADLDVICLDQMSYLDESITDPLFFADLADGIYRVVTDRFVVVDQMGYDLLELETVVFPLLLHQQLFIELRRKCVAEEILLHVSFVIFGSCPDD